MISARSMCSLSMDKQCSEMFCAIVKGKNLKDVTFVQDLFVNGKVITYPWLLRDGKKAHNELTPIYWLILRTLCV